MKFGKYENGISEKDTTLRAILGIIALLIPTILWLGVYVGPVDTHPNLWMYCLAWIIGVAGVVSAISGYPKQVKFFKK